MSGTRRQGTDASSMGEQKKYREQCILLHHMIDRNGNDSGDSLPSLNEGCKYTSFLPIKGDPTTMMSVLSGRSGLEPLMNLTPYQMSFLVPKVKLYKTYVQMDASGNIPEKEYDLELLFPDNFSGLVGSDYDASSTGTFGEDGNRIERMLSSRSGRGTGVGIRQFSWRYLGTNPAEASNLLEANLSVQFSDMRELFDSRGPFKAKVGTIMDMNAETEEIDAYYRYVDLIMRTSVHGEGPSAVPDESTSDVCKWAHLYDPTYFELKAVVGWAYKDGAPFSDDQRASLESCSVILYLTIVDHVINYNEDGTVTLDIKYKAAIDTLLDDPVADLFLTPFERARQAEINAMIGAARTGEDTYNTQGGAAPASGTGIGSYSASGNGAAQSQEDTRLIEALEDELARLRGTARANAYRTMSYWTADKGGLANGVSRYNDKGSGKKLNAAALSPFQDLEAAPYDYGPLHGSTTISVENRDYIPRTKWVYASRKPEYGDSSAARQALEAGSVDLVGGIDESNWVASAGPPGAVTSDINNTETSMENQTTQIGDLTQSDRSTVGNYNTRGSQADHQSYEDARANFPAPLTLDGDLAAYPIPFVYYGDLLDWAIRKAFWHAPYDFEGDGSTPTELGFYVASEAYLGTGTAAGYNFAEVGTVPDQWRSVPGTDAQPAVSGGENIITLSQFVQEIEAKSKRMQRIKVILGSMLYWDPVAETHTTINIADIPIALSAWNAWVSNRIMRPGVYSYTLKQFINDTLTTLVLDIVGSQDCYEAAPNPDGSQKTFTRQMFDVGIVNFTLPALKVGSRYVDPYQYIIEEIGYDGENPGDLTGTYNGNPDDYNYRLSLDRIQTAMRTNDLNFLEVNEDDSQKTFHYIAIYARGYDASQLYGEESDEEAAASDNSGELGDVSRGIYHFYLGQNTGLLKSVSFSRTDQAYLAESRLLGHGRFGYNQLRGRYEVQMVMQGNTLFLPGQLIYLNPDSVGSGDWGGGVDQPALLLGLG
ncbi:MAG TPA: hypothetical protein DEQ32_14185, partial [Gammaproteobacteria bacterium]|nr:hypothetical protein [Gammaproteobacteria bacterium]